MSGTKQLVSWDENGKTQVSVLLTFLGFVTECVCGSFELRIIVQLKMFPV